MTHFILNKWMNEKNICWALSICCARCFLTHDLIQPSIAIVWGLYRPHFTGEGTKARNQSLEKAVLFPTQVCLAFLYHDFEQSFTNHSKDKNLNWWKGNTLKFLEAAKISFVSPLWGETKWEWHCPVVHQISRKLFTFCPNI